MPGARSDPVAPEGHRATEGGAGMNRLDDSQLEAEADAHHADAVALSKERDRLGNLRWVVVSMVGDKREVAAFLRHEWATEFMDQHDHHEKHWRLEDRR